MSNFNPLSVVGRGSKTQLKMGENLNRLTYQDKGLRLMQHFSKNSVKLCKCT